MKYHYLYENTENIKLEITDELIEQGYKEQDWRSFEAIPINLALKEFFPEVKLFVTSDGVYAPTEKWRVCIFHISEELKYWINQYNRERTNRYSPHRNEKIRKPKAITLYFREIGDHPDEIGNFCVLDIYNEEI